MVPANKNEIILFPELPESKIKWQEWQNYLLDSITNQMMVPKRVLMNMKTFWIKSIPNLKIQPGDCVQAQGATGDWSIPMEVASVQSNEIELIAPAMHLRLRAGDLVRAGGCTWALDRDYQFDRLSNDNLSVSRSYQVINHLGSNRPKMTPGAFVPSPAAFQGHNLADAVQRSLEKNRIDWSSGGKEKLILDLAKEFVDTADMFVGMRRTPTVLAKVEAKLDEMANFIKNVIPPYEFDQIYPAICRIISEITANIRLEDNTDRFRRQYLGHPEPDMDDPICDCGNPGYACVCDTGRMMREGEKAAKKQIRRPDAPWKLDT